MLNKAQQLSEAQTLWYGKLKESGFEDIEDHTQPDKPLKKWHSFRFVSSASQEIKSKKTYYQEQIDAYSNDPSFREILRLLAKRRNSIFCSRSMERIWDMHRDGRTERFIADEMKCSQACIHSVIKRIKAWMQLL